MANVHGLYSNKKDDSDDDDSRENRYVGGVDSRGGGRYVSFVFFLQIVMLNA
jgi:hypothetical protein